MTSLLAGKRIVIIIEGISIPAYTKLWDMARALRDAGAEITVICPATLGAKPGFERLEDIDIHRHPLYEANTPYGFILEYAGAILFESWILLKILLRGKINVIHGASPPDLIFLLALPLRLFGVKFVFDHHDISPEMYEAKFRKRGWLHGLLKVMEYLSYRTCSLSIEPNKSYVDVALGRGGMKPENTVVVRSAPNLERIKPRSPNQLHRKGRDHLVGYVGVIEKQDCLELLLQAISTITAKRSDVQFAVIGDGTELERIKQLASALELDAFITFHGWIDSDEMLCEILSTCDLCVGPDGYSDYADWCTTIKILEYMALRKPMVLFDLKESRVSAGESALYAQPNDVDEFAANICRLLDDEALRHQLGDAGYRRIMNGMSWESQQEILIRAYAELLGRTATAAAPTSDGARAGDGQR